jgi:hypothetical protein
MDSLLVLPKDKNEFQIIADFLSKMGITSAILTEDAIEDLGMIALMKEADRTKKVSREAVMQKLRGA